ncbi:unnamed protein product [Brachionus calyciflorus]|uniref:Uncharacterized protein n=1 Tax=Brachionus calyciflorus TaxID=104777 RepID=A0A814HLC5_9BILA|nr:unnamed protein product [Brachionus calyciflorus]
MLNGHNGSDGTFDFFGVKKNIEKLKNELEIEIHNLQGLTLIKEFKNLNETCNLPYFKRTEKIFERILLSLKENNRENLNTEELDFIVSDHFLDLNINVSWFFRSIYSTEVSNPLYLELEYDKFKRKRYYQDMINANRNKEILYFEFLPMKQLIDFYQIIFQHKKLFCEKFTEIKKNKYFIDFKKSIEDVKLFLKSLPNDKEAKFVDVEVENLLKKLEPFKVFWINFLNNQEYYKNKEKFKIFEKCYLLSASDVFQKKTPDQIKTVLDSKKIQYNNISIEKMQKNFENYQKNLNELDQLKKKPNSNKIKEICELDDELDLLLFNDSFERNVKFFKVIDNKKDLINQMKSSIPKKIQDLNDKESYFRTLIKIKESLEKVIFFIDDINIDLEVAGENELETENIKEFVKKIDSELKSWEQFTLKKKIDNINQKMLDFEKKENEFLNSPGLLSEEKKDYEKIKSLNISIGREVGNILLYGIKTSKPYLPSEYCISGSDCKKGGNSGNSSLPTTNKIQISADFGKGGRKGPSLGGIYRDGLSESWITSFRYLPFFTASTYFSEWVKAPHFTMSSITADDGKKSNEDLEQYFVIKDSSIKEEFEKLKGII